MDKSRQRRGFPGGTVEKKGKPTPVFLPGKLRGQRSLAGYSPWGRKELDTTKHTCTHTGRDEGGVKKDIMSSSSWNLAGHNINRHKGYRNIRFLSRG